MRCLTICPSKGRPAMLQEMIASFRSTSDAKNDLLIVAEEQCPDAETMIVAPGTTVTECFNQAWRDRGGREYDFVHMTNDDVLYVTPGWDSFLMAGNGGGVSWGDDGIAGSRLCTFPMLTRELVEAAGFVQYPKLRKFRGDNFWLWIGAELNQLYYMPNIKLIHRHHFNNMRKMADNFQSDEDIDTATMYKTMLFDDIHLPDRIKTKLLTGK